MLAKRVDLGGDRHVQSDRGCCVSGSSELLAREPLEKPVVVGDRRSPHLGGGRQRGQADLGAYGFPLPVGVDLLTIRRRRLTNGASASFAVLILALVLTLSPEAGVGKDVHGWTLKAPTSLRVTSATSTAVTIEWAPTHRDSRVSGYGIYIGSARVGETPSISYTLTGLACGTTISVSVDAFDAAGNRSDPASILVATAACIGTQPPTTPVDTQAPAAPTGLNQSSATTSAVTVYWTGATDNVLVVGYGVYLDGVSFASTQGSPAALSGLVCSKTYSVGVDAFDAAGNRSVAATATVTTAACATTLSGGGVGTANLWVSPVGNDAACLRSAVPVAFTVTSACSTFNRAYQLANLGDVVRVRAGSYAPTTPSEGANKILPAGKSGSADVSFLCDDGPVTQASPGDQFVITAPHVTIRGGCFQFNRLWIGDAPNNAPTDDVTIDGVAMMMFEISGSSNVTIQNSIVGPDVACYGPGNGGRSCQNNAASNEKYFFDNGRSNTSYTEPKIHNLYATNPTNITIRNNSFRQMQSRDSFNLHTGCLWLGWSAGGGPVTLDGNTFERCAVYDVHVENAPNVVLQNNAFGPSVEPVETGSSWDTETNIAQTDVQYKCGTGPAKDWLVRFNTFTHGVNMDFGGCNRSVSNVRLIGNVLGVNSNCAAATVTVGNIAVGSTCGGSATSVPTLGSLVVRTTWPIDYHLRSGLSLDPVTQTSGDFDLGWDVDGQGRPGGARDPGADQR